MNQIFIIKCLLAMKNLSLSKVLFLLLLTSSSLLTACRKDGDDPAPDLASRISGTYRYSELSYDGNTIPADQTNLKGTILITRRNESFVNVKLDIRLKSTNEEFMVMEVADVQLNEAAGTVDLIYESERVAGITGDKLTIKSVDEEGVFFTLSAVR